MRLDFAKKTAERSTAGFGSLRRNVLIGEDNARLNPGGGMDKPGAPSLIDTGEVPAQLPQGQTMLGLGLRVHEVGDPLGLGQVEAAIFNGTARELARFGGT